MNCQNFESIIDDFSREQLIEAGVRADALRHTDECVECALRLADGRLLTLGLRELARVTKSVGASPLVERNVLAAFHEAQSSMNIQPSRRVKYLGLAAVLLVGFGIGIVAWNWSRSAEYQVTASSTGPSLPAQAMPVPGTAANRPGGGSKVKREISNALVPSRRPPQPRVKSPAEHDLANHNTSRLPDSHTEVATDFIPIGYANSLGLQDGGLVVRVALPRSTIVSMGFAINMNRYDERVKADVLMSPDGLARAIRFVE